MGFFDRKSSTSTSTSSVTQLEERNLNVQDNRAAGGGSIIGGNQTISSGGDIDGDINITTTDFGAVDGAFNFASDLTAGAGNVINNSLDAVESIALGGLDVAGRSIDANKDLTNQVLARESILTAQVIDTLNSRTKSAIDTLKQTTSGTLDAVIGGLQGVTSTEGSQRQNFALYGFLAVGALAAAWAYSNSRK